MNNNNNNNNNSGSNGSGWKSGPLGTSDSDTGR